MEFIQPRTVIAWQKKRFRDYWRRLSQSGKPGRPAISKEVIDLIRDMWRSNPTWGSPRIVGELHKIGITVAKSTVEKYRPKSRKPSSPTWKEDRKTKALFKPRAGAGSARDVDGVPRAARQGEGALGAKRRDETGLAAVSIPCWGGGGIAPRH